jgi:phosphonate transport system ATP-binding protein
MDTAIGIRALNKTFRGGRKVLQDIELSIVPGEMVAHIGASGSGKSTLLRHLPQQRPLLRAHACAAARP